MFIIYDHHISFLTLIQTGKFERISCFGKEPHLQEIFPNSTLNSFDRKICPMKLLKVSSIPLIHKWVITYTYMQKPYANQITMNGPRHIQYETHTHDCAVNTNVLREHDPLYTALRSILIITFIFHRNNIVISAGVFI